MRNVTYLTEAKNTPNPTLKSISRKLGNRLKNKDKVLILKGAGGNRSLGYAVVSHKQNGVGCRYLEVSLMVTSRVPEYKKEAVLNLLKNKVRKQFYHLHRPYHWEIYE